MCQTRPHFTMQSPPLTVEVLERLFTNHNKSFPTSSVGSQHDATLICHCMSASRCSTAPAAVDQYLLQTRAPSSKPAGRRWCCRSMRQTDVRTDTGPLQDHLRTVCLEQVTAVHPISRQFHPVQISSTNPSVCWSLISTVLLPPSEHLRLRFKPCA